MEGRCEKKNDTQISLYFMRRGRQFIETSLCSISVADIFDQEVIRKNIWSADINSVSSTYKAALFNTNEIIPIIVVHDSCTIMSYCSICRGNWNRQMVQVHISLFLLFHNIFFLLLLRYCLLLSLSNRAGNCAQQEYGNPAL